eukprot:4225626-Lingulodinium_polyedra.AAC.1
MIHEAAPRFEIDHPVAVTLKCQHWRLVTIDGIRARVTLGYLPFEIANLAKNVLVAAANLMPTG